MNLDRFSVPLWKEKPFVSKYDPDKNNPIDRERIYHCDMCNAATAVFESDKVKVKWCRKCDGEVIKDFGLNKDDTSYI
jgi:hypothetical protein